MRSTASIPQADAPIARVADTLGHAMLIALPLAMWLAGRSAPLMLGLAALALVTAGVLRFGARSVAVRAGALLRTPIGLALSAFLLWALASAFWSHRPAVGLRMWGEFALPMACGLTIAASGAFRPDRRFLRWLAGAVLLAAALLIYEFRTGFAERAWLAINDRQQIFYFNRPVLTSLILAVPLATRLWRASDRALALALLAAVGALVAISDSEAAKLGLAVTLLAWLLMVALPRLTLPATALAFLATMALAPLLGALLAAQLPSVVRQNLQHSHEVRIDIWESFGEAARLRPLAGSGFNAAATLQDSPVAAAVSEPRREMLAVGHPHSAPLQAWVDIGLIGVALLAAAGALLLLRLWHLPSVDARAPVAFFAGSFAIAAVAHGAWQGWWTADLAFAALLFSSGTAHNGITR